MVKTAPVTYAVLIMLLMVGLSGCGSGDTSNTPEASIMSMTWSLSWHLDITEGQVSEENIATNGNGDFIAVWRNDLSGGGSVWAASYDKDTGALGNATDISSGNTGLAFMPDIAMDSTGNTVAVWCQDNGSFFSIYANTFDHESGTWGSAIELDYESGGHAFKPRVAMDGNGNVMVVWYQKDGGRYSIFSSRYDAALKQWSAATLVEESSLGDAYHPEIDGNSSGVVMATWKQYDGEKKFSTWANRYDPESGLWGTAEIIEDINSDNVNYPKVAINENGDAVVTWYMYENVNYRVYANRFEAETGAWGEAVMIEDDCDGDAYLTVIDMDENSNIIVAWIEDDGVTYALNAIRYDSSSGQWSESVQIDSGAYGNADTPQIAMDKDGNAIIVWQKFSECCKVASARYDISSNTWGDAEYLSDNITCEMNMHSMEDPGCGVYEPRVLFDSNGEAVVIWRMDCDDCDCVMVATLS